MLILQKFFQQFMKRLFTLLLFATVLTLVMPALAAGKGGDFVVVIDPGHGGRDYGAIGSLTNEKTINLNVGLSLRRYLKGVKGLKVVMTRDDDRFIELQERANIANHNHGDLFVSIHVNSVAKSNRNRHNIQGASVYALGLHRTASNLEVAKRENSVMELEPDYSTRYQGFNPNSTESYIMFELSQNKHLDQSIRFAEMAEGELCSTAGRRNRGVLQAGFWVLHASAMPAVLVELDFICNPTVEGFLNSKSGVDKMARSLANAIKKYVGVATDDAPVISITPAGEHPDPCPEPVDSVGIIEPDSGQVTWRVQFMALDRSLGKQSSEFRGLKNVEEYIQNGLYKYTAGGDFATEEAAERYASQVVRKKFPEAFVIKWKNGQRVN